MRYADLEAHHDLGLGAEEPHVRRFTRVCERQPVAPPGSAGGTSTSRSSDFSGADVLRAEALDRLEGRIARAWTVWEGLREGASRTNLAAFIHSMEDRADQLKEDLNRGNTAPPTTAFLAGQVIEGDSTTHKEK